MLKLAKEARVFAREGKKIAPPGVLSYLIAIDRRLRMMLDDAD